MVPDDGERCCTTLSQYLLLMLFGICAAFSTNGRGPVGQTRSFEGELEGSVQKVVSRILHLRIAEKDPPINPP